MKGQQITHREGINVHAGGTCAAFREGIVTESSESATVHRQDGLRRFLGEVFHDAQATPGCDETQATGCTN